MKRLFPNPSICNSFNLQCRRLQTFGRWNKEGDPNYDIAVDLVTGYVWQLETQTTNVIAPMPLSKSLDGFLAWFKEEPISHFELFFTEIQMIPHNGLNN